MVNGGLMMISVLAFNTNILLTMCGNWSPVVWNDSVCFAGVVSEAEGPISTFLIVAYIILILWAVLYQFLCF
ncbi:MAG: hypothetical protein KKI06_00105 [Euryarchaeota archaeon]|nr:hypothetical protein [Euryarchaeota archaeon]